MLLYLGLIALCSAWLEDDDVVVLKTDTYDDFVNPERNFIAMLEFYAPWCGHCKQFAPTYAEIAKELKARDPPIRVAKIDATEERQLAQKFGVTGYPTMKLLRNGEVTDWKGGRDKQEIIAALIEMSDPDWVEPPSDVLVLDTTNFEETVNSEDFVIVEFYAPWCGHCKKLEPEWEAAASVLKKEGIVLAKVDATENQELAQEYDVSGYPTIKMFRKGNSFDYNGGREKATIISYLLEQAGPPSLELNTAKSFENILKKGSPKGAGTPVIAFFEDANDPLINAYADGANHVREDYQFYHVYGANVKKFGGVMGQLRIYQKPQLQSKFEKPFLAMDLADKEAKDVKEFVISGTLPLVGHYTKATAKYYDDNAPYCLVFYTVDFGWDYVKETQMVRNKVLQVAKNYRTDVIFAVADDEEFAELMKKFNLQDSGEDVNVGCKGKDGLHYPMPEDELDVDTLGEFIADFVKDKAKAFIKSKPIPKTQGDVIEVVGKSFKDVVMNKDKDVLIEFYAPWCGHCKQLVPTYNELGAAYADNDNVVIAKMDATANDIARADLFAVQGFPTIFFKPAGGESVQTYDSGRDFDSFKAYIDEHAVNVQSAKDEL